MKDVQSCRALASDGISKDGYGTIYGKDVTEVFRKQVGGIGKDDSIFRPDYGISYSGAFTQV